MPNECGPDSDSDYHMLDDAGRARRTRSAIDNNDPWKMMVSDLLFEIRDNQMEHSEKLASHNIRIHTNHKASKKSDDRISALEKTTKHLPLMNKGVATLLIGALTAAGSYIWSILQGSTHGH